MLAAIAGFEIATHYGIVSFAMGTLWGLKALTAAVVGGIGSVPGAALGGLLIGLFESLWAGYLPSDYKEVAVFAVLATMLTCVRMACSGRPPPPKIPCSGGPAPSDRRVPALTSLCAFFENMIPCLHAVAAKRWTRRAHLRHRSSGRDRPAAAQADLAKRTDQRLGAGCPPAARREASAKAAAANFGWGSSTEGRQPLAPLKWSRAVSAGDDDYGPIRALANRIHGYVGG